MRMFPAMIYDGLWPDDLMCTLLNKDSSLTLNQIKSFRSLSEGTITLMEQTYELIPTDNKRHLIYKDNILVDTAPIEYNPTMINGEDNE